MIKPRTQRATPDESIQKLRPKLGAVPGLKVFLQNIPSIRIGSQLTKTQYQYTLQDADTEELFHSIPLIQDKLAKLPGFQDVTSDLQIANPQVTIDIDRNKAMYEACMVRFRPIMMTTMAALMGTLPIALGWGAGAEARRPLGLAVVGGLLLSQLLALYITPVIYLYLEQARLWRKQA